MTADPNPGRTQGETLGPDQEPIEAGERDTVQERQAKREGEPPRDDPAEPDSGITAGNTAAGEATPH